MVGSIARPLAHGRNPSLPLTMRTPCPPPPPPPRGGFDSGNSRWSLVQKKPRFLDSRSSSESLCVVASLGNNFLKTVFFLFFQSFREANRRPVTSSCFLGGLSDMGANFLGPVAAAYPSPPYCSFSPHHESPTSIHDRAAAAMASSASQSSFGGPSSAHDKSPLSSFNLNFLKTLTEKRTTTRGSSCARPPTVWWLVGDVPR